MPHSPHRRCEQRADLGQALGRGHDSGVPVQAPHARTQEVDVLIDRALWDAITGRAPYAVVWDPGWPHVCPCVVSWAWVGSWLGPEPVEPTQRNVGGKFSVIVG